MKKRGKNYILFVFNALASGSKSISISSLTLLNISESTTVTGLNFNKSSKLILYFGSISSSIHYNIKYYIYYKYK